MIKKKPKTIKKKETKLTDAKLTDAMIERQKQLYAEWKDEGDGYFSLSGSSGFCTVAYIALPTTHPDCNKDYDDLNPDVNGGLTWGNQNVYGWDYGHHFNRGTPEQDIKKALKYFKMRGGKLR